MQFNKKNIIFYDGECGLCNRSVAFVLKHEKEKTILFAAIQSEFTTQFFEKNGWNSPDLSTFYFYENGTLFTKSTAALKLSKHLKFPQSWLRGFFIVPRFIRDWVYDFIAARRRRISKGFCVLPTTEERKRFID